MSLKKEGLRPPGLRNFSFVDPIKIIDDFESNDLSGYTNTADFSVTTSAGVEQTYGLEWASNPDNAIDMVSSSGDGLSYYPSKGDKFSVLLYDDGYLPLVNYGLDAANNNSYSVLLNATGNSTVSLHRNDGVNSFVDIASVTGVNGQTWYEIEVQWHDGSGSKADNVHELTVYEIDTAVDLSSNLGRTNEVGTATGNDSNYANNDGVGFANGMNSPSGTAYADRYWYLGQVD